MKKIAEIATESRNDSGHTASDAPVWKTLERFIRNGIQQWVQRLSEQEIDDLLLRRSRDGGATIAS